MIHRRTINLACGTLCAPYVLLLLMSHVPVVDYGQLPFEVYALSLIWVGPMALIWATIRLQISSRGRGIGSPPPPAGRANSPDTWRFSFTNADFRLALVLVLVFIAASLKVYVIDDTVLADGITAARYGRITRGGGVDLTGLLLTTISGAPGIFGAIYLGRLAASGETTWYANLLLPMAFLATFLTGGRNSFALNFIFLVCFALIRGDVVLAARTRLSSALRRMRRSTVVLGLTGLVVFLRIFLARVSVRETRSTFDQLASVQDTLKVDIYALRGAEAGIPVSAFLGSNLFLYLTSAFFHLGNHMQAFEPARTNGALTFYPFFLMVDQIAGTSLTSGVFDRLTVSGVYYTLPGMLLIDFGFFGAVIASLIVTILTVAVLERALRQGGAVALLASYLLLSLVVSGLFSAAATASGPSLLVLSLVFVTAERLRHLVANPLGNASADHDVM